MNSLFLVLLFVGACVVAMLAWQNLLNAREKLADLHDEMRRNDRKLESEFQKIDVTDKPEEKTGPEK